MTVPNERIGSRWRFVLSLALLPVSPLPAPASAEVGQAFDLPTNTYYTCLYTIVEGI